MTENKVKVEKQLVLPLKHAVKMSLESFRIRLGRSIIVTMSILLGIAFLMSILASNAFTMAIINDGPEALSSVLATDMEEVQARQAWLITLSLLVCTVGIINAMLMSVTERSKEIGTMKCLGALDKFVVELFLLESLMHGVAGSVIGSLIGFLVMMFVFWAQYGGIIFSFFPGVAILQYMLFSVLLGTFLAVIGAIYPAYVSATMEPAEAIRREV